MHKNSTNQSSMKQSTNGFAALRFFNITKYTVPYWSLLLAVSGILLALELLGVHRILGLTDMTFWQDLIAPFCRELEQNFVGLYTSQISTTFLVTALLSVLGGKDDPIYWTSAMEYKLINPKGTSLRDITWYCLGMLATSLIAIFFRGTLMFLFSFSVNLIGLAIVTCRVILAFFARTEILLQLQRDFLNAKPAEKQRLLGRMEDNIVQAAHNHNVAYLQECVQFFHFIEEQDVLDFTKTHFERLRWFFQIIPDELNGIRWDLFTCLTNLFGIGDVSPEKKHQASQVPLSLEELRSEHEKVRQELKENKRQWKELEAKRKTSRVKKDMAALQQQIAQLERRSRRLTVAERPYFRATSPEKDHRRLLQDDVLLMLHNNIHTRVFTARDTVRWGRAASALSRKNISELFALAETNNAPKLDFQRDFKNIIYLLKEAWECNQLLDDYMFMFHELHRFVDDKLWALTQRRTEKGCDLQKPAVHCYDWQDTVLLFRCICDENAMVEKSRSEFLVAVLAYSVALDRSKKKRLADLVTGTSALSDSEKTSLLKAIRKTAPNDVKVLRAAPSGRCVAQGEVER